MFAVHNLREIPMKKITLTFITLLVLAAGANGENIAITSLTDLGAGVVPNAINNNGQVVGQDASGQAFLWQSGSFTPLGNLGGTQSCANDINDNGVVVGWAADGSGTQKAFKWNGTMTSIDSSSAVASVAQAVNNEGDVVGWRTGSGQYRSVVWYYTGSGGPLFGGLNTKATGINDNRQIVGYRLDLNGNPNLGFYKKWTAQGSGSRLDNGLQRLLSSCWSKQQQHDGWARRFARRAANCQNLEILSLGPIRAVISY